MFRRLFSRAKRGDVIHHAMAGEVLELGLQRAGRILRHFDEGFLTVEESNEWLRSRDSIWSVACHSRLPFRMGDRKRRA